MKKRRFVLAGWNSHAKEETWAEFHTKFFNNLCNNLTILLNGFTKMKFFALLFCNATKNNSDLHFQICKDKIFMTGICPHTDISQMAAGLRESWTLMFGHRGIGWVWCALRLKSGKVQIFTKGGLRLSVEFIEVKSQCVCRRAESLEKIKSKSKCNYTLQIVCANSRSCHWATENWNHNQNGVW